MMNYYK